MAEQAWIEELAGRTAGEVVHRKLTAEDAGATVGELRASFAASASRKLAVLVDDAGRFVGSVRRDGLAEDVPDDAPAREHADPSGAFAAEADARVAARAALADPSLRRPVVDADGRLVGVVAVDRDRAGLCGLPT